MKSVSCLPPARSNSCLQDPCVASHPSGKPESLSAEVKAYCNAGRKRLADSLEWFGKASSLREAIQRAALSLMSNGKVHPHQRRVTSRARQRANELLQEKHSDIQAAPLFEDLMSAVEDVAGKVSGSGELATYDIALRIGQFKDLKPVNVYLHAGARDGAMALGIQVDRVVPISTFGPEVQDLEPYEIEDFLCVYKDCFAKLPKAKRLAA